MLKIIVYKYTIYEWVCSGNTEFPLADDYSGDTMY